MKTYKLAVVLCLYILLLVSFSLGGLSHKFRWLNVLVILAIILTLVLLPLFFYNLDYEFSDNPGGVFYMEEKAVFRTLAILNHFGEPIRILTLSQPLAYLTGKMYFEIRKTLREFR